MKSKVEIMMKKLAKLGVFRQEGEKFYLMLPFDLFFRGHLAKRLIENPDPLKIETYINESIVEALNNYNFFQEAKTEEEIILALKILRTYLKEEQIEKLIKELAK